ncbi:MAG: hypothetical protein J2P19_31945, partial [Pseudonocardia sp.]|nr:hypothetical protein [Pseudonocardia sp.]
APPASALAAGPGPASPPSSSPPSPSGAIPPPNGQGQQGQGPQGQQGQGQDQPKPGQNGPESPHADGSGGPNQSGLGNRESDQAGAGPGGNQDGPGAGGNQDGTAAGAGGGQPGGGPGNGGDDGQGDNDNPLGIELSAAIWLVLWVMLGLLVVLALLATPATIRAVARRHRLARAAEGGPEGADAAWRELLAEFQDRGGAAPKNSTVRRAARRLARAHRLDSEAIGGMRTVVGAVEHGWYAKQADPRLGPTLVTAVSSVRAGLDRSTPLTMPGRLWPRSVRPKRAGSPR